MEFDGEQFMEYINCLKRENEHLTQKVKTLETKVKTLEKRESYIKALDYLEVVKFIKESELSDKVTIPKEEQIQMEVKLGGGIDTKTLKDICFLYHHAHPSDHRFDLVAQASFLKFYINRFSVSEKKILELYHMV